MWAWLIWFIWACVILCIFICSMAESQSSSSEGSSWRVLRNCLAVRPVRQALEEIWSIQIMEAQCDNSKNQQLSLRGRHFRRAEPLGLNQRGAININSRQLYNHIVLHSITHSWPVSLIQFGLHTEAGNSSFAHLSQATPPAGDSGLGSRRQHGDHEEDNVEIIWRPWFIALQGMSSSASASWTFQGHCALWIQELAAKAIRNHQVTTWHHMF